MKVILNIAMLIPGSDFRRLNESWLCLNSYSAKFLKIHSEMEWVDLWQLL